MNDPREMAIRPESGVTLEQDNRVETMYHWGAMVVDYCDLPVSEYMKPMQVIVLGGEMPDTGNTMYTVKFVIDGETVFTQELNVGDSIPFEINAEKENRNFKGWYFGSTLYSEGATMPARNITLTAKYECDVTFIYSINGEETIASAYTLTYGSKPTKIPSTTKEGYDFKGWTPSITEPVKGHTTYVGLFEIKQFTVTWSGYTDGPIVVTYNYGDTIELPEEPTKEGYSFSKWSPVVEETVTKNITYIASFVINKYTINYFIKFNEEEGDVLSSTTVTYNNSIPSKAKPSQSGYTFTNWKYYNSLTDEEFVGTKMPAFDLKGISEKTANIYKLSYYDNGDLIKTDDYYFDETIIPFTYIKEGWTVSEWVGLPEKMPYRNVSAHCTTTINQYTVTFKDQNDNIISAVTENFGTPIKNIVPSVKGHTYEIPEDILNSNIGAKDMVIIGELTINEYKVSISIDGNVESVKLPYGTNIEEYIKENYKPSEGYNMNFECENELVPDNDETLVIVTYKPNVWKLYYSTTGANENDINGERDVEFGAQILSYLPSTDLTGFIFNGWFNGENQITESDLMPNNDLTVNGKFNIQMFNVTIKDGDNNILSKDYSYGTKLESIVNEDIVHEYINNLFNEGYIVTIDVNLDDIINGDLIINVNKTEREFTLTFKNGDEIIKSEKVKFNSIITYPTMDNYTENGVEYVFSWNDTSYNGKPMPLEDLTISGQYKEKGVAPIYYGTVLTPQSSFTTDNISRYYDETKLNTERYYSVEVSKCIGNGCEVTVVCPPFDAEPLDGLSKVKINQILKKYYELPVFIMPTEIIDNGKSIEIIDGIGTNIWGNYITDKNVINIDGNEYYFYAHKENETLIPTQSGDSNLKLKIKIN